MLSLLLVDAAVAAVVDGVPPDVDVVAALDPAVAARSPEEEEGAASAVVVAASPVSIPERDAVVTSAAVVVAVSPEASPERDAVVVVASAAVADWPGVGGGGLMLKPCTSTLIILEVPEVSWLSSTSSFSLISPM